MPHYSFISLVSALSYEDEKLILANCVTPEKKNKMIYFMTMQLARSVSYTNVHLKVLL